MKLVLFVLTLLLSHSLWAQSFSTAKQQSNNENKPLLLIFSGSDWCGGCIGFQKSVLDTPEYQDYKSKKIIQFIADFPRDRNAITPEQLEENQELANLYNKRGQFPYLVLFAPDGKILKRKSGGFTNFENFKNWLESNAN